MARLPIHSWRWNMNAHKATIVVDLGFGDAGKGTIVDFLSRTGAVSTIVRFNGGAQAGHNVITPEGVHHTFSQFGSGSLVPYIRTHLSRFMLLDPVALINEANYLRSIGCGDMFVRLTVDENALVVTPFQKAANRIREVMRGLGNHGSCGMGIGETMADSIAFPDTSVHARDLRNIGTLTQKMRAIQEIKREEFRDALPFLEHGFRIGSDTRIISDARAPEVFAQTLYDRSEYLRVVPSSYLDFLFASGSVIFEGAQGVLIDEWHGFHPYTTWSTTTFANAEELLRDGHYDGPVQRLGVLRAYFVRHGPGPFPTEDPLLSVALPDIHNRKGRWQGNVRVGWFDAVLARYALEVCGGVDALAITNLDRFLRVDDRRISVGYDVLRDAIGAKLSGIIEADITGPSPYARVTRLKTKPDLTDLSYQEAMTAMLNVAKPIYQDAPRDNEQYLSLLEQRIGVPVGIESWGETALQKHFRLTAGLQRSAA